VVTRLATKSTQAGMRSSLPLQVSRCQGEFGNIIINLMEV
jgi:hypothetical protein